MTETRLPAPGEQIHFLTSGMMIQTGGSISSAVSHVTKRGETVTVTDRLIDASRHSDGSPGWIGLVHDAEGQIERWGEVRVAPGPFPEGTPTWMHGDPEWAAERERRRKAAWATTDPEERTAARRRVEEEFGDAPRTSKTINDADAKNIAPTGKRGR